MEQKKLSSKEIKEQAKRLNTELENAIKKIDNKQTLIIAIEKGFLQSVDDGVIVFDYRTGYMEQYKKLLNIVNKMMVYWDDETMCRPIAQINFGLGMSEEQKSWMLTENVQSYITRKIKEQIK
jgi:hypothetical protein